MGVAQNLIGAVTYAGVGTHVSTFQGNPFWVHRFFGCHSHITPIPWTWTQSYSPAQATALADLFCFVCFVSCIYFYFVFLSAGGSPRAARFCNEDKEI